MRSGLTNWTGPNLADFMRFLVSRRQADRLSEWLLLGLGILCWICALIAGLSISQRYLQRLVHAKNGTRGGL